jgi:hypothetical protein
MVVTTKAKRGRPKKLGFKPYLRDLEYSDPTEIIGKEKGKSYRFCEEKNVPKRQTQGYRVSDNPNLKFRNPDGSRREKYWAPEGIQRNYAKAGLVLMEIDQELYDMRQQAKQDEIARKEEAMDSSLRNELIQRSASEHAGVLAKDDKFIRKLKEEMERSE